MRSLPFLTYILPFLIFVSITQETVQKELPSKIDLGIIIDTSTSMGKQDFTKAKEFILLFLDNFSISPGTTRVGLYSIGTKIKEIFNFKTHVNRECILKTVKEMEFRIEEKTYEFPEILQEGLVNLHTRSKEVTDQRRIYLFISNDMTEINESLDTVNIQLYNDEVIALISIQSNEDKLQPNEDTLQTRFDVDKHTISEKESLSHIYQQHNTIQTGKLHNNTKLLDVSNNLENENYHNSQNENADNLQNDNNDNLQTKLKKNNILKEFNYKDQNDVIKILKQLELSPHSYSKCDHDLEKVLDECDRLCTCSHKKLKDCYRIRKEFNVMTRSERRRYLKAYKTLTTMSPYKEKYERFVFMHYKYFCWGIHTRELFLPWHRWFISKMEDLLKQIDCRVTLPYWDWSYVSKDPWNRTLNLWRSTDDGIGGNGNKYKGYCVQKGIFKESQWETPYWEDPMDIILSTTDQLKANISEQKGNLAFCLRRAFKGLTPSALSVQRTLALPPKRFKDFDIQIRHNYHDRIHNIVGGTMCTHYAADTPEFWFHHAFLDKIWYLWQEKSSKHKFVHFLQKNTTKMMGCKHTQKELVDSHNLPRCVKVKYTKFPIHERNKRDTDDIDDMARTPYKYWDKYMTESWNGDFPDCSRSKKEKERAKYLHKTLDLP